MIELISSLVLSGLPASTSPVAAVGTVAATTPVTVPVDSVFERILAFFLTFNDSLRAGWIHDFVYSIQFFSTFLSLLFVTGLIVVSIKISEFHNAERLKEEADRAETNAVTVEENPVQVRWQRVMEHMESANPNDWRLAILEADIMLDDLLTDRGYQGDTLGEKLKSIDKSSFTELDNAWEAHRIRNLIAHEGADFTLPQREAQRVIGLYGGVFRYANYI